MGLSSIREMSDLHTMINPSRSPHFHTDGATTQARNDGEVHCAHQVPDFFGNSASARYVLRRAWMSSPSHAILRLPAAMARRHVVLGRAIATHPRLRAQSGCDTSQNWAHPEERAHGEN